MQIERTIKQTVESATRDKIAWIRSLGLSSELQKMNEGDHYTNPRPTYIDQFGGAKASNIPVRDGAISDKKAQKRFGAPTTEEFTYWAWRSCGIVDIQMAIETLKSDDRPNTMTLIQEALSYGGYDTDTDTGWYHNALVKLARKYGLSASAHKWAPPEEIALLVRENHLVLASIESPSGGHLLLIFGTRIDNKHRVMGFFLHNPNNYEENGLNIFMTKDEFLKRYKYRLISINTNE